MTGRIAFQGEPGAYSHQACRQSRPDMEAVPCPTFEDVIDLTRKGEVDLGMLAVENSTYGRVADVHGLLPQSGLHIIDEAFVRVHISLLAVKGTTLDQVRRVRAHEAGRGPLRRARGRAHKQGGRHGVRHEPIIAKPSGALGVDWFQRPDRRPVSGSKVVKGGKWLADRLALRVHHAQARLGLDSADPRDQRLAATCRRGHCLAGGRRCGEQQLVIVATSQGPAAPAILR